MIYAHGCGSLVIWCWRLWRPESKPACSLWERFPEGCCPQWPRTEHPRRRSISAKLGLEDNTACYGQEKLSVNLAICLNLSVSYIPLKPQSYIFIKRFMDILHLCTSFIMVILLYFDLRPGPKMLFQGDAPEGSDTFQWPVIERDRVGGLRLIIWDKVKVPRCPYRDAPEESNLWTAWQLFPLDDD